MLRRYQVEMIGSVALATLLGSVTMRAQEPALAKAPAKIETVLRVDLAAEEGAALAGVTSAMRVTVPAKTITPDHTHTQRTSIVIMLEGTLTDVRGDAKKEYKLGDVFTVSEGTTHHAENYGTVPVVYIEINTSPKK
jgi:quercetin dioxygenase-like cupin family protein